MIAELQTVFRWSARRVGRMTLREVERLYLYWRRYPTEHRIAVLKLKAQGWEQPEKPRPANETVRRRQSTIEDLQNFAAALGVPVLSGKPS